MSPSALDPKRDQTILRLRILHSASIALVNELATSRNVESINQPIRTVHPDTFQAIHCPFIIQVIEISKR